MDDQVIENPEEEEEHEKEEEEEETLEEEELQSEVERLIEVMIPPISDQELEELESQVPLLPQIREEMIAKIASAIERGTIKQR